MFDKYEYWGVGVFSSQINMAVDEFLIRRIAKMRDNRIAAVRFYSFPHDSIILGYAQDTDVVKKLDANVELARRITGGSHVQTGPNTLAYSIIIPRDGTFKTYEDMRSYYAECVANALSNLGIKNITVDNKASTINVDGRVIEGHAIWWGIQSCMLHGLITLTPYDVDKIASRILLQERIIDNKVYSEYSALKNLPTIYTELNGRKFYQFTKAHVLRKIVSDAILKEITENVEIKQIDEEVINRSFELLKQRYGTSLWVNKHEPTFTKDEVDEIPGEEINGSLRKNRGYCFFLQVADKDFKRMAEPIE